MAPIDYSRNRNENINHNSLGFGNTCPRSINNNSVVSAMADYFPISPMGAITPLSPSPSSTPPSSPSASPPESPSSPVPPVSPQLPTHPYVRNHPIDIPLFNTQITAPPTQPLQPPPINNPGYVASDYTFNPNLVYVNERYRNPHHNNRIRRLPPVVSSVRPPYAIHENLWHRQQNNQEIHRRYMTPVFREMTRNADGNWDSSYDYTRYTPFSSLRPRRNYPTQYSQYIPPENPPNPFVNSEAPHAHNNIHDYRTGGNNFTTEPVILNGGVGTNRGTIHRSQRHFSHEPQHVHHHMYHHFHPQPTVLDGGLLIGVRKKTEDVTYFHNLYSFLLYSYVACRNVIVPTLILCICYLVSIVLSVLLRKPILIVVPHKRLSK